MRSERALKGPPLRTRLRRIARGKYKNSECKTEGGKKEWEKEPVLENEFVEIVDESGSTKFETSSFTIECKKDTSSGDLEELGKLYDVITFEKCEVKATPQCTVSKFKFVVNGALTGVKEIEGEVVNTGIELKLSAGSEVTISGSELCAFAGTYKIKGKQVCQMPNLQTMKTEHQIVCKAAASEFEAEGKVLKFTGTEKVELKFGGFWGAS